HAIADDSERLPGQINRRVRRCLETPGNVFGEAEAALDLARPSPIDDERPEAAASQIAQKTALGAEVENVVAVDERRHDEERRAVRRAIVEEAGRPLLPDDRRLVEGAAIGMMAIALESGEEAIGLTQQLALERRREGVRSDGGEPCCELPRCAGELRPRARPAALQ